MVIDNTSTNPVKYVDSNLYVSGKGPTRWFASTTSAHQETWGPAVYGLNRGPIEKKEEPEEPGQPVSDADEIAAVIAASDKAKISLQNDLTLTAPIVVGNGKDITFDLGGNTITANNSVGISVLKGIVTIENGNITGSQVAITVQNGGEAIINSGTFTTTASSAGQVMNAVGTGSKLIINGGTFNSQETGAMAFDGATIEINGGTFNATDNFPVGTNGTNGRGNNTLVINKAVLNGNITSAGYEACGIYVANNDNVIVGKDVEINVVNGCGILMRGGQVTVKKGVKINLTTDKSIDFTGYVGDNKTKMSQSGIIYHESANYPGKVGMSLTVEDGVKITGVAHSIEILSNEVTPNVNIGNGDYIPIYPEV